ncbi:MAG TPA: translation initiation factor IF-2 N-terminal domain-containing protein, partial [Tetragenococcus sp.]|nr:translation initiation factor IF-2 N-terminal domain-containing protein [Tetragenococcus sp.]
MGKKRIYELAKEINKSSKEIVETAQSLGFDVKNHMGSLSETEEKKIRQNLNGKAQNQQSSNKQPANKGREKKFQTQRNNPNFQNRQKQAGNQNKSNQTQNNWTSNQNRKQSNTARNHQTKAQADHKVKKQNNDQKTRNVQQQNRSNDQRNKQQNKPAANRPARSAGQNKKQDNQKVNVQAPKPDQRKAKTQASTQSNNQRRNNNNNSNRNNNNNRNNNFNRNNNRNRNKFNKKNKKGRQQEKKKPAVPQRKFHELPKVLEYTEGMNVADIAKKIHREPAEIIKKLFMMGVMVNQNQPLDKDTIELLATDYGIEPQEKIELDIADIDKFFEADEVKEENLVSRPPVVTIMGHVDHGKTTLLDHLRHSRVTSGEAGGITQHIGAYQVNINGKPITFLDTPGHAAFTSMRARGASITDITILVVAADDGVMPQTVEAINHAKAAEVPIIVAINKIDKPGANPQQVMQELSEYELIPESWGGDTIFVEISAKFDQNIEELLEMVLLVAEVEDLKADPSQRSIGSVIEARLDKGKG